MPHRHIRQWKEPRTMNETTTKKIRYPRYDARLRVRMYCVAMLSVAWVAGLFVFAYFGS